MKSFSLSLLFLCIATGSFAFTAGKKMPGPGPGPFPPGLDKIGILKLVNEARKKGCQCGTTYYEPAPPLTWNEALEQAALEHSHDMFVNKYFSHTAPDGSRAGDRIAKAGYHWTMYGENIGLGFRNEKEVVEGWLKSPGHCKNIMNRDYKEMGVARVGNYWTQNFGRK